MSNQKTSFRFEINSFSVNDACISSPIFVSGGVQWFVKVHPKVNDYSSLFLSVANRNTLGIGWKRSAKFNFVIFNQSQKVLYRSRSSDKNSLFCAEKPTWGFTKALPHNKIQEEGENLTIEVYVEVAEAFDGEGGDESEKKTKTVDINGFQVLDSQVTSVKKIFTEHPDIAQDFKPKNEAVKSAYMDVLIKLIVELHKPPKSLSESTLSKASHKLNELIDVGFKLDWLKLKLEEIYLEKQKSDADESRFQQVEKRLGNLELMQSGFTKECLNMQLDKINSLKRKLDEVSLVKNKPDDAVKQLEIRVKGIELMDLEFKLNSLRRRIDEATLVRKQSDEARAQDLEKRVEDIELMELGVKLVSLETKLNEVTLERKISDDADEARAQDLEKRVKDLELKELGLKLEEVSLEKKKSDADHEARVQELEKRVEDIELMESGYNIECLKAQLYEISMERNANEARAKKLENRVKDLELMELGFNEVLNAKLDHVFLGMEQSDESRAEELEEERVKNIELMEMRSKLDSLKTELDERKKSNDADEARAQHLEKRVKDLELMDSGYNLECLKVKLDEDSMERKKSDDADKAQAKQLEKRVKDLELNLDEVTMEMEKSDEARAEQLEEERVKNIELMELRTKLDSLKTDFVEASIDKKESDEANAFRVQELELRVQKDLEMMDLRIKMLEDGSVERNITENIDRSRVEQLEESVEFLLKVVSDLKVELGKKKDKSNYADGFMLVDEVDDL